MTFEYVIPGETVVKRCFAHELLERDLFSVIVAGEIVATVSYDLARQYWVGKITLQELINHDAT